MSSIVTQRFIQCHNILKESGTIKSSRSFARELEYLPQSLSEILKGRRDVTIELLRKAIERYEINPSFIFCGEGDMFSSTKNNGLKVLTIVTNEFNEEKIMHVPVPAQAGYASEEMSVDFFEELPSYSLPDYGYKSGTHRSFDVAGDSMEPSLFEGDKIICSFIEPALWPYAIKNDHVYVVVTKSNILVKRVKNYLDGRKELELISDNRFYEPFIVAASEIKEIWYLKTKISAFDHHSTGKPEGNSANSLHLMNVLEQQSALIKSLNSSVEKLIG